MLAPRVTPRVTPSPQQVNVAAIAAVTDPATSGLRLILEIERDARRARTIGELHHLMANETRRAVGARQVFVLMRRRARLTIETVSSLSSIERNSPTIVWVEQQAKALLGSVSVGGATRAAFADPVPAEGLEGKPLSETALTGHAVSGVFPFRWAALQCVAANGTSLGAVLAVRETPFSDAEALLLQRLCETFGHAWDALKRPRRSLSSHVRPAWIAAGVGAGLLGLGLIPVPLTALAPAEIVPRGASIVSAPIDGAIEAVDVDPNQVVRAGDVLFRYQDAQLKGALDVAAREVSVAEARLRQVTQMAFVDMAAKRELAVARSELALKRAEHAFAAEMHERSVVRAARDGVAVFADKRELIGRPISTGNKVMEIADPAQVVVRINVLADDALVLKDGAQVRIFMDSDPLNPLAARILRSAPMARVSDTGVLGFRTEAQIDGAGVVPPLGHRGTAQIVGDRVSLAFFLFRRPLAAIRQRFGL